jgi:hypothetical protein
MSYRSGPGGEPLTQRAGSRSCRDIGSTHRADSRSEESASPTKCRDRSSISLVRGLGAGDKMADGGSRGRAVSGCPVFSGQRARVLRDAPARSRRRCLGVLEPAGGEQGIEAVRLAAGDVLLRVVGAVGEPSVVFVSNYDRGSHVCNLGSASGHAALQRSGRDRVRPRSGVRHRRDLGHESGRHEGAASYFWRAESRSALGAERKDTCVRARALPLCYGCIGGQPADSL